MPRGEAPPKPKSEPGQSESAPPLLRTIAQLWTLVGGLRGPFYHVRLWISFALTLAGKVLAVFSPLVLADGINALSEGRTDAATTSFQIFLGLAGLWTLMRLLSTAGPQLRDALFQPISEQAQRRAGTSVFSHVHALSVRFHQSKRTGAVYRTIERGVRAIDFLLRFLAFNIAPTVIELALAAGVLAFRYGAVFAAIAAATVFLYAWLTFGVTEWRLKHRRTMNEADSEAAGRAVDSLLNFETVKSFAAEARESERYDRALASYAEAAVRSNTSLVLLNVLQGVMMNIGLLAMVLSAGWLVASGPMGPGDITAVILIMTNLYAPLNILGFAYREIKQSSIDMEKMFTLLDEKPDVADAPGAVLLQPKQGEVAFEQVSFAHEGRDVGLDAVAFIAHAGQTTAIVGPSGAGKSTVLKLLFRFYDPASGRVTIDGQDLRGVTQTSLRDALGLVPQDVVLFNDTIRYNISYGRPEASQAELEEAAARAQLLTFIEIAAARLGNACRRAWPETFGRREAARRHRARGSKEPEDTHPRRSHVFARQRHRSGGAGRAARSVARTHHHRCCAQAVDNRRRRSDRGARSRADRRTRYARSPDRQSRALRRSVAATSRRAPRQFRGGGVAHLRATTAPEARSCTDRPSRRSSGSSR